MKIIKTFTLILVLLAISCTNKPHVIIETNLGAFEIELDGDNAPKHVENFLKLVDQQYYKGITFHRVIPEYLIQGGDPNSKDNDKDLYHNLGGNRDNYVVVLDFRDEGDETIHNIGYGGYTKNYSWKK